MQVRLNPACEARPAGTKPRRGIRPWIDGQPPLELAIEIRVGVRPRGIGDVLADRCESLPLAQRQAGWSRLQMAYLTVGDEEARKLMRELTE